MRKRFRKPLIPAIVALLAIGVAVEVWYSRQAGIPETALPASSALASSPIVSPTTSPLAPKLTPSPTPAPFTPPDEAALHELDNIGLMLRDYRTIAGENPVGTNAEIMATLMGGNEKQAILGPPEGMKLNDKGELLDRWGTPYFFHQISRDHMEIRSAGPDKVLWTEDDPVIR